MKRTVTKKSSVNLMKSFIFYKYLLHLNLIKNNSYAFFLLFKLNMKDLLTEMNKIKSKKFYNNYTQTITTFNNINNEVMNKIIQTDETIFVSKRQMFTQTVEMPVVSTEQLVKNVNLSKVSTSRSSTTSSIFERLTGSNKNLHFLVPKQVRIEKDKDESNENGQSTIKSYANRNLNYEKIDHSYYFRGNKK
jgi:hypothetical protein